MEIQHTTRRNPEMEKYVRVEPYPQKDEPNAHRVMLVVGNQGFTVADENSPKIIINGYFEDQAHAEWMRDMLCIALAKIVKLEQAVNEPSKAMSGES